MPELDLDRRRRIHVVGVGGAGMSAIATVLAGMGHEVTGSDRADSATLRRLAADGLDVWAGHDPTKLADAALVTASTAVAADDPELEEASRLGIPTVNRAGILAAICATRRTIAVAGTKGKTTTTAMTAAILGAAGWRPSFLVGGEVPGVGGGARWIRDSEWLVVEADESDGTFLRLPAEAAVVTNVEADHLDHYGSLDALADAFGAFLGRPAGPRVVGIDSERSRAIALAMDRVVTAGTDGAADVAASAVVTNGVVAAFDCTVRGSRLGRVTLGVPGRHNVRNACAALALAGELGIPFEVAAGALAAFRPVARRFEWRGRVGGADVIDDYAHLPSALDAAVTTARAGDWRRVIAVFQPHLYSRTANLGAEMGKVLAAADLVVVTDVYAARESPIVGVSGALVADAARAAGADVRYVPDRADLADAVRPLLADGDVCLLLGAGDITSLAAEMGAER